MWFERVWACFCGDAEHPHLLLTLKGAKMSCKVAQTEDAKLGIGKGDGPIAVLESIRPLNRDSLVPFLLLRSHFLLSRPGMEDWSSLVCGGAPALAPGGGSASILVSAPVPRFWRDGKL